MKRTLFYSVVIGACLGVGCNSGTSSGDSVDSSKAVNDSMISANDSMGNDTSSMKSMQPVSKNDADYAVEAANGGITEIELSKLAKDKATTERIKSYADMMVTDHTKAGDELKSLAKSKNIVLPDSLSKDSKKKVDDLTKKSGKDFDKAYLDAMSSDHKKTIDLFQKDSSKGEDADLKNFAVTTLPTIRMHYDSVKAIQGKK